MAHQCAELVDRLRDLTRPFIKGPGPEFQKTLRPNQVERLFRGIQQIIQEAEDAQSSS